jgi:hypothetical protein
MRPLPRTVATGVQKAPRHEVAGSTAGRCCSLTARLGEGGPVAAGGGLPPPCRHEKNGSSTCPKRRKAALSMMSVVGTFATRRLHRSRRILLSLTQRTSLRTFESVSRRRGLNPGRDLEGAFRQAAVAPGARLRVRTGEVSTGAGTHSRARRSPVASRGND